MEVGEVEFNVKTAFETACYYKVHHKCNLGLHAPSYAECKSCMMEEFESIIRLRVNEVAGKPTHERTLKRWKR